MSSDPTLGDPTDQEPHTWLGGERDGEQVLGKDRSDTLAPSLCHRFQAFLSQPGAPLEMKGLLFRFLF